MKNRITKNTKCPLSGYKATCYEMAIHNKNKRYNAYFMYEVNVPFLPRPIFYAFGIYENEKVKEFDSKKKWMLWSLILENKLNYKNSFIIDSDNDNTENLLECLIAQYGCKGESEYAYEHFYQDFYVIKEKELIENFPNGYNVVDRLIHNFIGLAKMKNEPFGSVALSKNAIRSSGYELFFFYEQGDINALIEQLITSNIILQVSKKDVTELRLSLNALQSISQIQGNSNRVFFATKFKGYDGRDMKKFKQKTIDKALREIGFPMSMCIDDFEYNGSIYDRIISEIKGCCFVIVDLSNSNPGAYFEAGFAEGIGKDIIYICESCWFYKGKYNKKLYKEYRDKKYPYNGKNPSGIHFDLSGKNIILYDNGATGHKKLIEQLKSRINATIK